MLSNGHVDDIWWVMYRSSRFARLQGIKCAVAGKNLYIRFTCSTGDAMGMNMVSKGVQNVLDFLHMDFPDMDVIGISGNDISVRGRLQAALSFERVRIIWVGKKTLIAWMALMIVLCSLLHSNRTTNLFLRYFVEDRSSTVICETI